MNKEKGEIIIYQPDDNIKLEVRLNEETVWLNRHQMASLFQRDVKTIGKHIANALTEELEGTAVVAKFATTAADGKTYQVEYYNLDVIISVGYRVKSQRGVQFRKWANVVLKDYLLRGYAINQRLTNIERKIEEHDQKIDFFVRTSLPPVEGIFFDGQIFDAYTFVSDLIRSAKKSIVLFDNYVDDTVLTMLDKRKTKVSATIYTQKIKQQLSLDLAKHNAQYQAIDVKQYDRVHDRYLCIDNTVYQKLFSASLSKVHWTFFTSLKDLGKRWFSFNKIRGVPVALRA
jgi:hypothetical protein